MKSLADSEFIQVLTDLHEHLLTRVLKPAYMILDNEASPTFQIEFKSNNIDFELSPPAMRIRNAAEWAISTFNDQFIEGICSKDPDFPMKNWDRLV